MSVMKMKLFLQRDTSGLNARYRVFDDRGELRFLITGRRNPSGESLRIRTPDGGAVCRIRSLGFSALCVYSISAGSESIRLNIAVGSGRAAVRFRGISFFVRGDVLMGSYSILDADTAVVCEVGKDFSKGGTQLIVHQTERELFCLAAAACIDSLNVAGVPVLQMT